MKKVEKKQPRPVGRPPAEPAARKTNARIPLRVSQDDLARLRENVTKSGKTLAEFVRERLGI